MNIPHEVHYVKTEDNYILRMHRLPLARTTANYRGVMFLMHGLFCASPAYLVYPNNSAAYFFAKKGYDIWMGNARGNAFSLNHSTFDPNHVEFWKFSWHEIGYYDLPAMIDHVLLTTNQTKLMYIGHSQGVTSVMVMLSTRPEYNDKIHILHAMTPPIIMKYHSPPYPSTSMKKINEMQVSWLELPAAKKKNMIFYCVYQEWCDNTENFLIFPETMRPMFLAMGKMCLMPTVGAMCTFVHEQIVGPSPHSYDVIKLSIVIS